MDTRALLVAAVTQPRPRVPEAGRLLWGWFLDLHATRSQGFAGPLPIAYAEIEAYARLHRIPMASRHVDILRAMDAAWLAHAYRAAVGSAARYPRSSQPINADAFDAVFG